MDSWERIAALRSRVLARKDRGVDMFVAPDAVVSARSFRQSEGLDSWQVRRGLCTRDRLSALRFEFDELELLAGRLNPARSEGTEADYEEAEEYLKQFPPPPGQTGHCELDLDPILSIGIDGIRADIQRRMDAASGDVADTYQSFLYALDGFSRMIENAADAAQSAAEDASPERQAELRAIEDSCRRIAHEPPATFRDAIQILWFAIFSVMHAEQIGLVVPGRLDRTLYPFYAADVARGALNRDEAQELIECLYLKVNDYVSDGLAMSVMVGGRDAEGADITNDLSYLCLEAVRRTGLIYPTVGVCWHEGTPADLVELAIDLIGHGYSTPAFFGDATIQHGLKELGVPDNQAHHYINSTCVEITPARGSNIWVASPYFSMCRILLDEIAHQVSAPSPAPDFESFRRSYLDRLARLIEEAVAEQNGMRRTRAEHGRKPLQSVFTRDCIARGRDIDDGGALYNWVECSFVGLANMADSFHVIREEVFGQNRLSLEELKAILDAGFEGHEPERVRFLQGYPKYGQDYAEVDALFGETVAFVQAECAKHVLEPDDSPFVPGAFCWVMHERLGAECGATPDGRNAGVPFADGCGPAQGRETCGPTAAILSTTSWDHSPMIGGLAYNMKFNSTFFASPQGYDSLRDLLLTFLRRGGFETQINVVDTKTLKKAKAHPEDYRDLVVRIGGYTDYFARLSPQMQDEVIMRTEFTG